MARGRRDAPAYRLTAACRACAAALRSLTRGEGGTIILHAKRVWVTSKYRYRVPHRKDDDMLFLRERRKSMSTVEELHPQYVVNEKGQKKAVILPVEEYEELLEDLSDLAIAAERREEGTVSHEQILKEINTDGSV